MGDNLTQSLLDSMQREGVIVSGRLEGDGAVVVCSHEQSDGVGRELVLRGVVLRTLSAKSRSLEEVFVHLVSSPQEARS
ncbi:MAG: hypothetical protein M3O36_02195 [Myxococcota bacterium]|nr:hypothetical protein [Myxococcota bacterium]